MRKIIMLYAALIPSARLCGYEQFKFLAEEGLVSFEAIELAKITRKKLEKADAVIFVRGDSLFEVDIAKKLKKAGKYLIYVLDDDLLNIPQYISSAEHYQRAEVRESIQNLMQLCHCLMTPSEKIVEKYSFNFIDVVKIEEPALGRAEYKEHQGKIKVGFAGSIDRAIDFERIVSPALKRIVNKYQDKVQLEFFGAKPGIVDELGCNWIPYAESYEKYQETMKKLKWDIGLAPMPASEFHICKHYNKFIEYGTYGIISVCSEQLPYTKIVNDWEDGILCKNTTEEWERAIGILCESESVLNKIRGNIIKRIENEFQIPTVSEEMWKQLDNKIIKLEKYQMGRLGAYQFQRILRWIGHALCKYKGKIFIELVKRMKGFRR